MRIALIIKRILFMVNYNMSFGKLLNNYSFIIKIIKYLNNNMILMKILIKYKLYINILIF